MNIRKLLSTWVFGLILVLGMTAAAQAQQMSFSMDGLDEVYTPVLEALGDDDVKAAERKHKDLGKQFGKTADWHYVDGMLNMMKMQNASAIRMPFLARGMRNSFERAVDTNSDHELSHHALALFYYNAPGIVGGDKDKGQAHVDELARLDSDFQYSARVTFAMIDEVDFETEEQYWQQWFEGVPDVKGPRVTYASRRINTGNYKLALEQLNWLDANADPEEDAETLQMARYQIAKLAAESGMELERGEEYLQSMLNDSALPANLTYPWVHARMAQIKNRQGEIDATQHHYQLAADANSDDENLEAVLASLRSEICSSTDVC